MQDPYCFKGLYVRIAVLSSTVILAGTLGPSVFPLLYPQLGAFNSR